MRALRSGMRPQQRALCPAASLHRGPPKRCPRRRRADGARPGARLQVQPLEALTAPPGRPWRCRCGRSRVKLGRTRPRSLRTKICAHTPGFPTWKASDRQVRPLREELFATRAAGTSSPSVPAHTRRPRTHPRAVRARASASRPQAGRARARLRTSRACAAPAGRRLHQVRAGPGCSARRLDSMYRDFSPTNLRRLNPRRVAIASRRPWVLRCCALVDALGRLGALAAGAAAAR